MITLKSIFNRVINKFIIFEYLYKGNLQISASINKYEDFDFSVMSKEDINNLKYVLGKEITDYKIDILRKRLDEDDVKVFSVKEDSGVIGYCCLSFKDYKENGINKIIHINEKQAYFFDDYICKRYRGMGLHYYTIIKRSEYAIDNGKEEGISLIYSWNKGSSVNFKKAEFVKVKKFIYIKIIKKLFECRV